MLKQSFLIVVFGFLLNCVGSKSASSGSFISLAGLLSSNQKSDNGTGSSGAVPPYTWKAITNPPPELASLNLPNGSMPPSASFSSSGFFRSTGTWNFLPSAVWYSVILVSDSIGQSHFKIIKFDSYDEAATVAACLLSGACG